jgi:hypothetical protein
VILPADGWPRPEFPERDKIPALTERAFVAAYKAAARRAAAKRAAKVVQLTQALASGFRELDQASSAAAIAAGGFYRAMVLSARETLEAIPDLVYSIAPAAVRCGQWAAPMAERVFSRRAMPRTRRRWIRPRGDR